MDSPEERCTLSNQKPDNAGIETIPDGERARYLDYNHPAFPSHWGEEDQMSKPATQVTTVNPPSYGHFGVVIRPDGTVERPPAASRSTPPSSAPLPR